MPRASALRLCAATFLLALATLTAAACTAATPDPTLGTPTIPAPFDEATALAELCDPTNESSLSQLSMELAQGDLEVDLSADRLRRAIANMNLLRLGPDALSVRDAALAALDDLQATGDDPAGSRQAASTAAQMLGELESFVCA